MFYSQNIVYEIIQKTSIKCYFICPPCVYHYEIQFLVLCAVCKGRNPGEMKFKQELMRHHLLMSLDNTVLTLFPYKPLRKHQPNIKEKNSSVLCMQTAIQWREDE